MFDGNGTEVVALYRGNSMSKNFQHIFFGESENITIQVSLIDSWSSVKIDYGTMKQSLDLGKEKKETHFSCTNEGLVFTLISKLKPQQQQKQPSQIADFGAGPSCRRNWTADKVK